MTKQFLGGNTENKQEGADTRKKGGNLATNKKKTTKEVIESSISK